MITVASCTLKAKATFVHILVPMAAVISAWRKVVSVQNVIHGLGLKDGFGVEALVLETPRKLSNPLMPYIKVLQVQ